MKKLFYYVSAVIAIASCSKEVDMQTRPVEDNGPEVVYDGPVTTILASVEPTTKSTIDVIGSTASYSWEENETIAVYDGTSALSFSVVDREKGTFQYLGEPDGELAYAVCPEGALSDPGASEYKLTLSSAITGYRSNVSNAIMVAGAPEASGDYKKFAFKHTAALIRFTFENAPKGTDKLVFSTVDKKINGTYSVTGTNPELTQSNATGSTSTSITLASATTAENSTLIFYVPIPTGDYTDFTVALYKGASEIVSKTMTYKAPKTKLFTAVKGGITNTPVITLDKYSSDKYVKVSSNSGITSGAKYLIVNESAECAMNGAGSTATTLDDAIDIAFNTDGDIEASSSVDAIAFTITSVTGGFSILSSGNVYIGGNNKSITVDENAIVNTISIDSGNASIASNSYTLYYNGNNTSVFRFYSNAQSPVQLYKRQDGGSIPQLSVPQNLQVNPNTKTVSWHTVSGASSYSLIVNDVDYSSNISIDDNTASATLDIDSGYYTVSVVAVSATPATLLNSNTATLTNAKFGTPTLSAPALAKDSADINSITVTWDDISLATNGYHLAITDGASYNDSKDVDYGVEYATFDGLSANTSYSITVYSKAVSSPLAYVQSSISDALIVKTASYSTIADIIEGSDTEQKYIAGATVVAISTQGAYIKDATGMLFAQQNELSPAGLTVNDVVNVAGKGGSSNSQRVLKECSITKVDGEPIATGIPSTISSSELTSLTTSFERQYVKVIGKVVAASANNYQIQVGDLTTSIVKLYCPQSTLIDGIAINKYVTATGYTMHITGSTPKYLFIMADSFTIHSLAATVSEAAFTSKTWEYNESGSVNKVDITISSDASWTYDASDISSWATVIKDGNVLTVYPSNNNTGNSNLTGDIVITHSVATGFSKNLSFTQKQQQSGTEDSYSLAFETIGSTGWSSSYGVHNGVVDNNYLTINLSRANKQGGTITDIPVMTSGYVEVIMKSTHTISAISFVLRRWNTKTKTVSLEYSINGGTSYTPFNPVVSSSTFTLSKDNLPSGTNALKMVMGDESNQVGIERVSITYN